MTVASYIQSAIIPIAVLLVIYFDLKKRLVKSPNNLLLGRIMLLLMVLLLVDAMAWTHESLPGGFNRIMLIASNMVYFALMGVIAYMWLIYASRVLRGTFTSHVFVMLLYVLPLVAHLIIVMLTPFFGLYFWVDANNVYHRGDWVWIQQAICIGYLLVVTVMALICAKKARSPEKRRECVFIALFILPPLSMAIVQILYLGTTLIWQGTALSIVFIYVNILHYQVALDGMTGLNNRRSLGEYLSKRIDRSYADRGDLYVIVMDINDFKSINDVHGHIEGDRAICAVAIMLRYHFANTDAFISRYGGDEFVVAVNHKNEDDINAIVRSLRRPLDNWRGDAPWPLSMSIGATRYDYKRPVTPDELIKAADDLMYEEKQLLKKANGGGL